MSSPSFAAFRSFVAQIFKAYTLSNLAIRKRGAMSASKYARNFAHKVFVLSLVIALAMPQGAGAYFPTSMNSSASPASISSWAASLWQQVSKGTEPNPEFLLPLERPLPEKQDIKPNETKEQLKARVGKFKSFLSENVEMISGEHFLLPIIPLDWDGHAVQGLIPEFESNDEKVAMVTYRGEIWAGKPGKAKVTVIGGASRMTINVTVSKRKPPVEDK